jgi:hypothetical protein
VLSFETVSKNGNCLSWRLYPSLIIKVIQNNSRPRITEFAVEELGTYGHNVEVTYISEVYKVYVSVFLPFEG